MAEPKIGPLLLVFDDQDSRFETLRHRVQAALTPGATPAW